MRPMKPRTPGSAHAAIARFLGEIAHGEGRDPEAGPKIAADFEGCSVSLLHAAADPDRREDIGFARVSRLTRHFGATALAEHLALAAGGVFLPLPRHEGAADWADFSAEAAREMGEALAAIFDAFGARSDGGARMTAREAQRVLKEIEDALRPIMRLHALAQAAAQGDGR